MTDRPTPEQIAPAGTIETLAHYGYVVVHPDDVLDWIERLSENPLGTPIYTDYTPGEALHSFMERFATEQADR